jgi:phosphoribosylamine--glycine ligase
VIASGGYPGAFRKGFPITGISESESVSVYHSGTCLDGDTLVTGGGRVLGVTGIGGSLDEALAMAYEAVGRIGFEGAFWRRDIGRTL